MFFSGCALTIGRENATKKETEATMVRMPADQANPTDNMPCGDKIAGAL